MPSTMLRAKPATSAAPKAPRVQKVQQVAAAVAASALLVATPAFAKLPDGFKSPKLATDKSQEYSQLIASRGGKVALPEDTKTGKLSVDTFYKAERIPILSGASKTVTE